MKYIRIKKILLKQIIIFCLVLIIVLFPGLYSCSYIGIPDKGETTTGNIISQTGENPEENDSSQSNQDTASGDSSKEEGNKIQEKKEIRLLLKDTVPLFASAAISHEAKNLFSDPGIIIEKEPVSGSSPDSYDILVDVDSPQSDSGNFLIYCAATGFFNICDNISISDFKSYW